MSTVRMFLPSGAATPEYPPHREQPRISLCPTAGVSNSAVPLGRQYRLRQVVGGVGAGTRGARWCWR